MRISDWSSDVCSSDLLLREFFERQNSQIAQIGEFGQFIGHRNRRRGCAGMFQTLLDEITKRAKGIGFLAVELQGVLVLIDLAGPFDPASDRELNIARNPRPRLAELDCRNARKRKDRKSTSLNSSH